MAAKNAVRDAIASGIYDKSTVSVLKLLQKDWNKGGHLEVRQYLIQYKGETSKLPKGTTPKQRDDLVRMLHMDKEPQEIEKEVDIARAMNIDLGDGKGSYGAINVLEIVQRLEKGE
ncbi:hypothetical protein G7Y79_00006g018980 [Physcia stellaris]|nr:hypothetical protein G7Y79_00006g018980 [Physcia stellaris]